MSDIWHTEINGAPADFYAIARAYDITDPAIAHALKKLLRCGRSHKSQGQDVLEAIASLQRWVQMEDER